MSGRAAPQITVVGSLNTDLVVTTARAPGPGETVTGQAFARHPGGKGGNQAVAAARLRGDRALTVAMIGRVGRDAEGDFLCAALAADGVDTAAVGRDDEHGTGIAAITVSGDGENRIVLVPGANAALSPAVLSGHHDTLTASTVILVQLEIPLPTVQIAARMGREKRAVVILDPAPARALPAALLRLCDFVTPNESELAALVGVEPAAFGSASLDEIAAAAGALLHAGARNAVVKLGARGALLVAERGAHHWPAPMVTAVDTTAAGDAWNGAFAVALAEGRDVLAAGAFATAASAISVTRAGAQPSLPSRSQIAD